MLPALRHVRVGLPRFALRAFSTAPSHEIVQGRILQAIHNVSASTSSAAPVQSGTVDPPSSSAVSSSSLAAQQFMTIPPEEDPLLHMFTSCIMQHGERQKASRTTAQVLLHLHAYTRQPPLELFRQALFAAAPAVRCITHRKGPKSEVKPIPLSEKQRMRKAIGWIWEVVNVRSKAATTGQTLAERTAREMIKILNGESSVLKKKEQVHLMALANRGSVRVRF